MRVYKVINKTSGEQVGMWYFDPYAREGKRSGAWMTAYREQERLNGNITTIVSNNCNFIKGKAGEPVLISWEDAETLFHGSALPRLHGLCSNVTYPALSGTNYVATDYVEFPSQILERWLSTPRRCCKNMPSITKRGRQFRRRWWTGIRQCLQIQPGFCYR